MGESLREAAVWRQALLLVALSACQQPIDVEWKRWLPAASVSTPLVTQDLVAVGHERGLSVFSLDGTPRCSFETSGEVIGSPAADADGLYVASANYLLYALDGVCRERWRFAAHDRIKADPLLVGDRVVLSSYDGHVYSVNRMTGALVWSFPAEATGPDAEAVGVGDFSYSSPRVADGVVWLGNLDHHLYGLDLQSGSLRYRFETQGPVTSTPWIEGDTLYIGSNDKNVYALTLGKDGPVERWRFTTGDWVNSSPVVSEGTVYVGSNDRHVYALDAASGALRWKQRLKGPVVSAPAVHEELVFAVGGSGDGTVYALSRKDGAIFWSFTTGGKLEADPVSRNGQVFVSGADQRLYAFRVNRTRPER